jgi:uncharacterized protein
MPPQHGHFVWYELMTRNPGAASAFYTAVVGWDIVAQPPGSAEYPMIRAGAEVIGGLFPLTDAMCEHGARRIWMGYVGVDDVHACIERLTDLGGQVLMPPFDIPGGRRIAMVADPQGSPFYVIRDSAERGVSGAFDPARPGHCGWNELATTDQAGALDFYAALFGWQSTESVSMGDLGEYRLLDHDGVQFGAVSPHLGDAELPIWTYYFRVADIDAATTRVTAGGGKLLQGPHEVPGDAYIIIAADLEGATFALVGPRSGG